MELEKTGVLRDRWYEITQANRSAGHAALAGTCGLSNVQIKLRHFRDAWRSRYFLDPISYT
jgi:hypothetical protein